MAINISSWDASEYLESADDIAAYLNAALEDGDPAILQAALGDVAKARGMSAIARQAGLGRESLYKSLSLEGNPSWATITKVLNALGLQLEIKSPVSA
ncbi:addiction module antidote protein [Varibaculum prostatecancerukia]|uniref:addiction module antidote protein n=1 Tax=Varibaculum prostatecancerukia TaxID=2811781 RepID=UPI001C003F13|nr:addiction module antidote protein [Varibaculum prostatecancerukia]